MDGSFQRRPAKVAASPRRVRGGRRVSEKDWPDRLAPVARRLLEAAAREAEPEVWAEGWDYAVRGQTRSVEISIGRVDGVIQGRPYRPYETSLTVDVFEHDTWRAVVRSMADQAVFAARLMAGELPESLDEMLGGHGVALTPATSEIRPSCTCAESRRSGEPIWCKHACCLAIVLADELDRDVFHAFGLRGLGKADLIEQLRQLRALDAAPAGVRSRSVVRQHVPGMDASAPALESLVDEFWDAGPELARVETTARPPDVPQVLLRRLGPSPFETGKFPLVGLLATCYQTISEHALDPDPDPDTDADADDNVPPPGTPPPGTTPSGTTPQEPLPPGSAARPSGAASD